VTERQRQRVISQAMAGYGRQRWKDVAPEERRRLAQRAAGARWVRHREIEAKRAVEAFLAFYRRETSSTEPPESRPPRAPRPMTPSEIAAREWARAKQAAAKPAAPPRGTTIA
jgi:hypothetical protein